MEAICPYNATLLLLTDILLSVFFAKNSSLVLSVKILFKGLYRHKLVIPLSILK